MRNEKIGVVFFNPRQERERRFQLSWFKLSFLTLFALVLCGGVIGGVSKLLFKKEQSERISQLESENEALEEVLSDFTGTTAKIESQLDYMKSRDDVLRIYTELPKLDEETWGMGKGGSDGELNLASSAIEPETAKNAVETEMQLQKFEQKMQLLIESLAEIEARLAGDHKLRKHTPSVAPIENAVMTSAFGYRQDPFIQKKKHHNGIDFVAEIGEAVQAPSAGIVVITRSKYNEGETLGKMIILDHGRGLRTRFGHLSNITVKPGQKVERFQKIGEVGNTGRSTGPHLHYEIWLNDQPIDPSKYILN